MSRSPYPQKFSRAGWWLQQPRYVRYMMREISAAFIGAYALLLIVGLYRLSQGRAAYDNFLADAHGAAGQAFAAVTIVFALYHTYTWFQVTPRAMPLTYGSKRVPGALIIAAHWFGFIVASSALWLLVEH